MSRPPLPPEIGALVDREREIAPLPATVRARAMLRARAALAAGSVRSHVRTVAAPRIRWAVAAALVCVAGAAVGAVAYEIRTRLIAEPVPVSSGRRVAAPIGLVPAKPSVPAAAPVADLRAAPSDTRGTTPSLSAADAARAELRLLRQARAAVARQDYAAALSPIAEHVRRFKDGRLAEEREALRVKALAGLGRTSEAQRAAAAFRARFPRSVLLPAVGRMPANEP